LIRIVRAVNKTGVERRKACFGNAAAIVWRGALATTTAASVNSTKELVTILVHELKPVEKCIDRTRGLHLKLHVFNLVKSGITRLSRITRTEFYNRLYIGQLSVLSQIVVDIERVLLSGSILGENVTQAQTLQIAQVANA
jgi:hypothetical protein